MATVLSKLGAVANVRVRLTYPEPLIKEPLLGRVVQRFDVLPNIRRAAVDDSEGWIICELAGDRQRVDEAIAWLQQEGVQVDLLGDVVE